MKSVNGVSSKPISISKAASTLSSFVSADDNGASQALCAYLRRASTSFFELKQLHKELKLKPLQSDRKHRHLRSDVSSVGHGYQIKDGEDGKREVGELKAAKIEDKPRERVDIDGESSVVAVERRKRKTKHKRKSEDGYGKKLGDDDREAGAEAKRRR